MKNTIFNVIFLSIIFIVSCSSSTKPEENIVLPESNLNFNDHIYPLFSAKCSSRSGCHVISGPAAGLVMVDYNDIITRFMSNAPSEPLIHIGDGDGSPLYKVLLQEGFLGVPRMPFNGPYLNSNQYEGIKTWINEGAIPSASK